MGRSDFEARIGRLTKARSAGAKRAVHEAMLQDKVNEVRCKTDEKGSNRDEDGVDSWAAWLSVFILFSFLVLGSLFVHDPEDAKRKALVMVPLMVFLTVVVAVRQFRHSKREYLYNNLSIDLDFIEKLVRMLR